MSPTLICGPCSFETFEDTKATVDFLTRLGVKYIRGGSIKYRSTPNDYQGTTDVYGWIEELKKDYDFKFVNEVFDYSGDAVVNGAYCPPIDVYQIGSRNQMNSFLLKELNGTTYPIILKRHFASSLNSFLDHAEYLDKSEVILCLRGTMGLFPQEQRFMPDVTDIPRLRDLMKQRGKEYKICYDVSHSACDHRYVKGLIQCANVYKPDFLMIETHVHPSRALSDAQQQISFKTFNEWFREGLFA